MVKTTSDRWGGGACVLPSGLVALGCSSASDEFCSASMLLVTSGMLDLCFRRAFVIIVINVIRVCCPA